MNDLFYSETNCFCAECGRNINIGEKFSRVSVRPNTIGATKTVCPTCFAAIMRARELNRAKSRGFHHGE